jgi:multiple sugar transport system permease protein
MERRYRAVAVLFSAAKQAGLFPARLLGPARAFIDTRAVGPPRPVAARRRGLFAADRYWAAAFATPYAAVFSIFVIYPIGYGLWLGSDPASYRALFADPVYLRTVTNTLLYLLFGVNLKLALALLLSGFFMRRGWWFKLLLVVFMLPWAIPALPSYLSINWMLNGQWGLINNIVWMLFQIDGPPWLDRPNLALASVIYAHIWKWMPFWTLIFLAGRMAIPRELYESADVDGASGVQKFAHVTLPLMAGLYLVCTLLSTIWALGDFNAVRFVSGGGPALSTHVLATLGIRNAFELGDPRLGMATVLTALPLLIPLVILLMRQLRRTQVTI